MTALSDQIVRQLLLRGRQSADTIGEALAFSTPVIERQLERMVTDGSVQASVDAADGPVMFTLTEEERRRCRGKYRQRTANSVELIR